MRKSGKYLTRSAAQTLAQRYHLSGKSLVFTNGCFDVIHPGHIALLHFAKSLGDRLIVALNSDDSVKKIKGSKRPFFSEEERILIISAFEDVDHIVIFDEETPLKTIKEIRPDVLIKGAEYSDTDIVGSSEVKSWGGRVERYQMQKEYSTSKLIETILSRYRDD